MNKLKYCYYCLLDAVSGGRLYHGRWMSRLGIPPVPAWTVQWFFDLKGQCSGRRKCRSQPDARICGGRVDEEVAHPPPLSIVTPTRARLSHEEPKGRTLH
jgi:hypothetical protein